MLAVQVFSSMKLPKGWRRKSLHDWMRGHSWLEGEGGRVVEKLLIVECNFLEEFISKGAGPIEENAIKKLN